MGIKQQIRKRRNERIQSILQHDTDMRYNEPTFQASRLEAQELYDPEYVWKKDAEARWKEWNETPRTFQWWLPFVICMLLFTAIWGVFQLDHPTAVRIQDWIEEQMSEDMDFARFSAWYQERFSDSPAFLPAFDFGKKEQSEPVEEAWNAAYHLPVKGKISVPFEILKTGVKIDTSGYASVAAMTEGIVVFVGELDATGKTIVIQHSQKVRSVYGHLDRMEKKKNDWVEAGETIAMTYGNKKSSDLYFAIKKDDSYMNPAEVLPFD